MLTFNMKSTVTNRTNKTRKVNANAEAKAQLDRDIPGLWQHDIRGIKADYAKVVLALDGIFGEGYAQKNPNVFAAALLAHTLGDLPTGEMTDNLGRIGAGLESVADALQKKVEA